ncbi:hypothetical protein [Agromyces bauzanensis]
MDVFWLVIGGLGGVLAVVDGIVRLRARRDRRASSTLAVLEIIVAALFVLSLLLPYVPWSWLVLGIAVIVVLVIVLVTGGRRGLALPIVALVLVGFFLLVWSRVLVIPGLN